jgi:hypothetical protein
MLLRAMVNGMDAPKAIADARAVVSAYRWMLASVPDLAS